MARGIPRPARAGQVAALAAVAALVTAGCVSEDFGPLRAGDALPAYTARTLAGGETTLPEPSAPMLVNVWATWCVPCRTEMPALQKLHEEYSARGLRVVGINVDTGASDTPVEAFLDDLGITFLTLRDPQDRVTRTFRLVGVPETLLIDRDGRIAHRWIGRFDPLGEDTRARIDALLPGA